MMQSVARFVFAFLIVPVSHAATVTAFVSPDNSYDVLEDFIASADELYLASYTLDSPYVADMLLSRTGKTTVLLEGSPAGGISYEEKAVLCRLDKSGVDVFFYGGSGYHHAKYIISGSKVLISSENFGSDGYPPDKQGNRGWGAVVEDEVIAKELAEIFKSDLLESERFFCDSEYEIKYAAIYGSYESEFKPMTFYNQTVRLIVAPDAVEEIVELIKFANSSLYVEQFYIYRYWDRKTRSPNLFLEEAIMKAREGKEVKIIMDGTFYNVDKNDVASNYYTNEYVNGIRRSEKLNIQSKLVSSPFDKVHTKALIADSSVLISSINWNLYSPKNNREIGLFIEGNASQYFRGVFMRDFYGSNEVTGKATSASGIFGLIFTAAIILFIAMRTRKKPEV